MGTGYTRNDSANNIADGNVINAADFDGEYDAIESAFNATSGHTHDGTASEGGPVTVLGPVQDFVASSTEIKPKTDNTLDIGTTSLQFKDLYLHGKGYIDGLGETILVDTDKAIQFRDTALSINSSTDGQLDIAADTEVEITTALVEISADATVGDDLTLKSDAAVLGFGADTDVTLTHVADTGLLVNAAMVVQFRDSAINIGSPADGDLDINADDEIELNSTLIDINGNVEISGTAAITGIATFTDDIIIGDGKTIGSTSDIDAITIAANGQLTLTQQLNGTAGTFSGILKTDDATEATSTTDGSLQTDGGLSIVKDAVLGNDIKLLSDSAVINFGADSDVTLTHEHNLGIQARAASGFELNLQTGDTSVESGNVLGKITFNAPVEGSGVDAILDGATIEAVAEDTFASDNNSTALVFKTNTSAAATERMRIKSDGTIVMDTQVDIDNITIDGNTISSTDTNGNVVIAPNGTGDVQLDADTIRVGDSNANAIITTNGTGDLTLSTNAGTNSGVITIADAANGNISITPNGSGTVVMDKVDIGGGAIDGTPVGANSASTGAFTTIAGESAAIDNITINGNTISSTDTNGNVVIDPAGTGNIHLGVFHFDADQGTLTDNHVLTYDGTGGTIQLEAIPAATIGGNLASDLASNGNNIAMADNDEIRVGAGNDIVIKWDGTDGHITVPTGTLNIDGTDGHEMAKFVDGGAVELYHDDTKTFETVAAGVRVTGRATSASITEEDDGSFDLSANNNFICVTAGSVELTFTNIVVGQSGNIKLVVGSGHAITANAVVGINSTALNALQTAGTYNLSYYVPGGNADGSTSGTSDVLVSVSGALTSQGA